MGSYDDNGSQLRVQTKEVHYIVMSGDSRIDTITTNWWIGTGNYERSNQRKYDENGDGEDTIFLSNHHQGRGI